MADDHTEKYSKELSAFRLMDDLFFGVCLGDSKKAIELIVNIAKQRKDIKVHKFVNQKNIPNIMGRGAILDVFATDKEGRQYNVEVQNDNKGAIPRRARFNASMLDYMTVKKGTTWQEIPKNCVIMISDEDILGFGDGLYIIKRTIVSRNNAPFDDGSEIIYINGQYEGDDDIGRLVHDLKCTNPDEMYFDVLANRVRYFKENRKGRARMCEIMQKLQDEAEARGVAKERLSAIKNIMAEFNVSAQKAMESLKIPQSEWESYASQLR